MPFSSLCISIGKIVSQETKSAKKEVIPTQQRKLYANGMVGHFDGYKMNDE